MRKGPRGGREGGQEPLLGVTMCAAGALAEGLTQAQAEPAGASTQPHRENACPQRGAGAQNRVRSYGGPVGGGGRDQLPSPPAARDPTAGEKRLGREVSSNFLF